MSRITPVSAKKRKLEEAMRGKTSGKPRKRIRKQKEYHSSSEEDENSGFAPVNLGDSDEEPAVHQLKKQKKELKVSKTTAPQPKSKSKERSRQQSRDALSSSEDDGIEEESHSDEEDHGEKEIEDTPQQTSSRNRDNPSEDSDVESDSESESGSDSASNGDTEQSGKPKKAKSKRNDPTAFSTSISKILSTKLPTSVRHDPVLSRSLEASKSRQEASNERLEARARAKLRAEKQAALQKGRTTDVLGIERGIAGEVAEKEKGLRKIAQKGVIQLFNAFRAAHVKAEEARRQERKSGTIGMGERERKVNEASKESFLELIGGKKKSAP